jgi:hypothetical protein
MLAIAERTFRVNLTRRRLGIDFEMPCQSAPCSGLLAQKVPSIVSEFEVDLTVLELFSDSHQLHLRSSGRTQDLFHYFVDICSCEFNFCLRPQPNWLTGNTALRCGSDGVQYPISKRRAR